MSDIRNIVVICLDSVRKDYFDEFTPRLQKLADTSFEQCRAASSCSVPSHASLLTGELPHQHGIHNYDVRYSKLGKSDTFLGDLPEHRSIGVSANAFAGSPFGFDTVFDEFQDISWTRRFPEGMDAEQYATQSDEDGLNFYLGFLQTALEHDHPIKTVANAALAQADISLFSRLPIPNLLDDGAKSILKESRRRVADGPEPVFLFMNLMEAHVPHHHVLGYDRSIHNVPRSWSSIRAVDEWDVMLDGPQKHEDDIERFRRLYGASIDYLDRQVAAFVEDIHRLTERETTFIVTADHGENLGFPEDNELFGHMSSLTEGLLHVPCLLLSPPDGYAVTEPRYVSQLEFGKLIAGLANNKTPNVFASRIAAERIGTTFSGVKMDEQERRYWGRMLRCVYEDEVKVVWDSLGEITEYEIDHDDPCWQSKADNQGTVPDWASGHFDNIISEYDKKSAHTDGVADNVDEFTIKRLEKLGYL